MSEFLHHLLGAGWNFLILAAALTLVSRIWLDVRLGRIGHPADFDAPDVLVALVLPAFLPLVWLGSSISHLMEPGGLIADCCLVLAGMRPSAAEFFFGAGLAIVVTIQAVSFLRRWRRTHGTHREANSRGGMRRVERVCRANRRLESFARQIHVVDCEAHVCMTRGLFRPRIEISASLVADLDDEALEAALLHELGHARMLDPLRSTIVLLAQVLNPFARLLARHDEAWRFATEVARDGDAVGWGARAVALADALVTAADRQLQARLAYCHLHGSREMLETRVHLLISGSSNDAPGASAGLRWLSGSMLVALALPHLLGAPFFSLHCFLEQLLTFAG